MKNTLAERLREINDYQEKANFFLKETKTTFSYKFYKVVKGFPNSNDNDKRERNAFKVLLKNSKGSYNFNFYGSINDYLQGNKTLSPYDVLACLTKFEPSLSLQGFMREFGYEITSQKDYLRINRIHKAVLSEYYNIKRLFDINELEALAEIN